MRVHALVLGCVVLGACFMYRSGAASPATTTTETTAEPIDAANSDTTSSTDMASTTSSSYDLELVAIDEMHRQTRVMRRNQNQRRQTRRLTKWPSNNQ